MFEISAYMTKNKVISEFPYVSTSKYFLIPANIFFTKKHWMYTIWKAQSHDAQYHVCNNS